MRKNLISGMCLFFSIIVFQFQIIFQKNSFVIFWIIFDFNNIT